MPSTHIVRSSLLHRFLLLSTLLLSLLAASAASAQGRFFSACDLSSSFTDGLLLPLPGGGVLGQFNIPEHSNDAGLVRFDSVGQITSATLYSTRSRGGNAAVYFSGRMIPVGIAGIVSTQQIKGEPGRTLLLIDHNGAPLWAKGFHHGSALLHFGEFIPHGSPPSQFMVQHRNGTYFTTGTIGADSSAKTRQSRQPFLMQLDSSGSPLRLTMFEHGLEGGLTWEPKHLMSSNERVWIIGTASTRRRGDNAPLTLVQLTREGAVEHADLLHFDTTLYHVHDIEIDGALPCNDGFVIYGSFYGDVTEQGNPYLVGKDYASRDGFVARFTSDGSPIWMRVVVGFFPSDAALTSTAEEVVVISYLSNSIMRFDRDGTLTASHQIGRTWDRATLTALSDSDVPSSGGIAFDALAALPDGGVAATCTLYPRWRSAEQTDSLWPTSVSLGLLHLDTALHPSCGLLLPDTLSVLPLHITQKRFSLRSTPLPLPHVRSIDVMVEKVAVSAIDLCTHDWPMH